MEKVWLKEYPDGVPHTIGEPEFSSLKDLFEQSCTKFRDLTAFTNMGRKLTYGELDQASRYFGAFLQKNVGLTKGERVAVMLPNVLQYPVAIFGALRAGLTAVNVNPLYTARELEHQLKDSGARVIVVLENFATTLQEVIDRTSIDTVVTTQVGDLFGFPKSALINFAIRKIKKMVPAWNIPDAVSFRRALNEGKWQKLDKVDVDLEDIAFLQYTGGTTGVSKGAMLSHGNLVSNVQQSTAWLGAATVPGKEIVITALPLYHIFSLTANCLLFMRTGGNNILITNPRDFAGFIKELSRHKFTYFSGVNTLFNALLNTPGFDQLDFGRLKLTLGGGMAVQPAVAESWKETTGCTLTQAYGLTETSPAACINPLHLAEFNGSIGLPISSTDVTIRDDDGNPLELGETGEICIRGPQVMQGYWNRPDETEKVMFHEEWLRTGDVGYMDPKGYVFIADRKKDMILVSGFNVYPNEVENVAVNHPGVLEAAAIGEPDERAGEVVKLFVVRKDENLKAEDIIDFCKKELTGYKVPKLVEFRDELPKTNVGKILRRALRDESAN